MKYLKGYFKDCKYRFSGKVLVKKDNCQVYESKYDIDWKHHNCFDLFHKNRTYLFRTYGPKYEVYCHANNFNGRRKILKLSEDEFFKYFIPVGDLGLIRKIKLKEIFNSTNES